MNEQELINQYGTPLYLYDTKLLKQRIRYLKRFFREDFQMIFAIKANSFVLKELDDEIDGYEICSYGEYEICQRLHLHPSKFIISGVSKQEFEIEDMLLHDVNTFTIESLDQYQLLNKLTRKHNKKIQVLIRLTSGNQFGVSKDDFKKIVELILEDEYIHLKGIEYFSGTQKHSLKKITREMNRLIEFVNEIEEAYHIHLECIEYGPGLPVFYFVDDEFDEEEFLTGLNMILSSVKGHKISLEIGRSLVASCGFYYTRIVDQKCNQYGNTLLLDGGIHHLVYYGQNMAMKKPYFEIFPKRTGQIELYNLYGSLCTVNDILLKNVELTNPKIGDIFVFKNVGAYSATEGISLFLSRQLPRIVIKDEKENYHLVRERIKTSEMNFPNYNIERNL